MPLTDIAKLFATEGPFASAYVLTESTTHDAIRQFELRRRAVGDALREQGLDEATAAAVLDALARSDAGPVHGVVAAHGGVLHDRHLPGPWERDLVRVGSLPYVLPLVAVVQSQLPYVVVLVDRTGADVLAYAGGGAPVRTAEVVGSHDQIERNNPGGWSQRRYENRAEDSWEGNAREVADYVGRTVDDLRARLVLVNGDVRACQFLLEHLPERARPLVEVVDAGGGRAVDGSAGVVAEAVLERVRAKADADLDALLATFHEERGQQDRACDGPRATAAALSRAQVATLLVADEPDDTRTAWFGPEPVHVALEPGALADLGVDRPVEGRLVDVLVRAVLGTGADVRVVPPGDPTGPRDGVGAVLRW